MGFVEGNAEEAIVEGASARAPVMLVLGYPVAHETVHLLVAFWPRLQRCLLAAHAHRRWLVENGVGY